MATELEVAPPRAEDAPEQERRSPTGLVALAVVASAALVWFGTGLTPIPWLTWLAPLPVLAVAGRIPGRAAAGAAFLAWAAGGANMWTYYTGTLEVPPVVVTGFLLLQAFAFAGAVALWRALLRQSRPVLAALAAPAAWAGAEYLVSLFSPGGSFSAIGYTQAELLPVIQISSLTGIWGVGFLLLALPALAATALADRAAWIRLLATAAVLAGGTAGYGLLRLQDPPTGPSTTVALADVRQSEDSLPIATPEAQRVLASYLDQAATAGAAVLVLPEKVFKVTEPELADLGARISAVAVRSRITIVIGLTLKDRAGVHNIAMAYDGTGAVRYDKQHLVTGWEDHMTAGDRLVWLPGSPVGLAICKDLDHPELGRRYGGQGTSVLLVPALDFGRDGLLHSRIAVVRGVENGFAVVRSAGHGRLVAADSRGRLVADEATGAGVTSAVALVRSGSGGTPYARFGDWFAWLCLVFVAVCVLRLRLARPA
ncbi:apolipoprotein N-acyltransferase [Catellatospora methionotrophica]|uniref:Apolipoprotein N-acyltransferase n=1 Tax=Catellatospora methionotrophica TaxID=121620 RepID=A0A8J3PFK1_9ACTN|nr:nitrilase-related carbon-nitrogen hydrolase [Catellatospora methionotrophica]GIG15317.1 apolipoprotein N-acyltransferase [Catellatospora methionotrophica]